jgi:hypothetical protein
MPINIPNITIPTLPPARTLPDVLALRAQQSQDIASKQAAARLAQAQASAVPSKIALQQAQAAGVPAKTALNLATARKTLQDIDMTNQVGNPQTPPLMRAYSLYRYNAKTFGEEAPQTIAAKNAYEQMNSQNESTIRYKNTISNTLPFSKLPVDLQDALGRGFSARGGILPSPGGTGAGTTAAPGIPGQQQPPQQGIQPAQQPIAGAAPGLVTSPEQFVQQMRNMVTSLPPEQQPVQSTKIMPTPVRNAVLGTGETPQNQAQIAPPEESTADPQQPNRLIHPAPASGQINAQQQNLLAQYSPAGIAQQKVAGADVQKFTDTLGETADKANDTLNQLRQFDTAYKQIRGASKGPVGGLIKLSGTPLNPQAQTALKNGNQLVLQNMGILKGTGSRLNQTIIKIMQQGNPNIQLSPEAEKAIVAQLNAQFQAQIHKSRLANTILHSNPWMRDEPQLLQEVVTKAAQDAAPVDEQGNIHPEMFDEWPNYAHPRMIEAVRNGQDALPEDISGTGKTLKQFRDVATAKNIPILTLVKRFRAAQQRQRTGGAR